jgi:hypothetical protein
MFEFHFVFLLYVAKKFQSAFLNCNSKKKMENELEEVVDSKCFNVELVHASSILLL